MTLEHTFDYRQRMHGTYVHISGGWPVEAFLQCWGRSARGWHGLIAWEARVRVMGTPERVTVAAWVPADRLSKPHYVSAMRLARLQLSANRLEWPAPTQVDCEYFLGCWDEGDAWLPEGVVVDSGPVWGHG